jgi:hypothetical protein
VRPALRSVRRHACRTSAGWSHTRKDRHSEVHRRSAARITRVGHALACPNWPKGCSRHGLPAPVRFTRTIRVSDALHQRCDRPISLLAAGRTCPAPTPLRRGRTCPARGLKREIARSETQPVACAIGCLCSYCRTGCRTCNERDRRRDHAERFPIKKSPPRRQAGGGQVSRRCRGPLFLPPAGCGRGQV